MGKVTLGIIAVVVLMIMFPLVLSSTHEIQTEARTDANLDILGAPAEYIVLTQDLWQADTDSVISITGNGTEEPGEIAASSYGTPKLYLSGVDDSTKATVTYEVEGLAEYTGMGTLVSVTPLLIWIAVIASIIGAIWYGFQGKFGGGG